MKWFYSSKFFSFFLWRWRWRWCWCGPKKNQDNPHMTILYIGPMNPQHISVCVLIHQEFVCKTINVCMCCLVFGAKDVV